MRVATLLRLLQEQSVGGTGDWVLVLPPWPRLYHWRSASRDRVTFVPWAKFFDLPSLNLFVPTIEFDEYLQRNGHTIDEVGTKGLIFREGLRSKLECGEYKCGVKRLYVEAVAKVTVM